jgi:amino acid adenylation domain-containing protein
VTTDVGQRLAGLSIEERNALARRLVSRRPVAAVAASGIPRRAVGGSTYPLSFAQQRFWFLSQITALNSAYNVTGIHTLRGPLDYAVLQRAFNEVVRRHEVLRTTFEAVDGRPIQRIHPTLDVPFEIDDITGAPDVAAELATRKRLAGLLGWDLEKGPLIRAHLWRTAPDTHVLLVLLHHIVADGWSNQLIVKEVTRTYSALAAGQPLPLAEPALQYADLALWQQDWIDGPDAKRQIDFWKQYMADAPVLQLPADRSGSPSASGTHRWLYIDDDLGRAVRALCQAEGVTVFMALLAAFGVLLSRYSGQRDVVIGSPMANRTRPEVEDLVGCLMNPLPLRVGLQGNPTFRDLLMRVRDASLGAFANQDAPFDLLVRTLQPRRDMTHAPLFQSMLLLHNFWQSMSLAPSTMQSSDYRIDPALLRAVDGTSTPGDLVYPVALEVVDLGTAFLAVFEHGKEYDTALGRVGIHFRTLLETVVARPDARIEDIRILDAAERKTLLTEWNQERRQYPGACAHTLFEAHAARVPETVAVVMGDDRVSYAELNRRANRMARRLRQMGVGPEARVGILLDRSPRMYDALLGVMKAGGAYVPLDPTYPAERLAYILQNSQISVLIAEPGLRDVVENLSAACGDRRPALVWIDSSPTAGDATLNDNVDGGATPLNLAYVIYTSGSTGNPKGTMISHGSLANAYQAWEEIYELRTRVRRHLQMASLSFDVFSGDLVRALCSGGTLVVAPHDLLFSPDQLYALMRREQVDSAEFVPVVLRDVIAYLEASGQDLSFLRLLIAGSDTWYANEYRKFRSFCGPDTRVINSYGVTESTIDSTWFESAHADGDGPVPLGTAFPNTELYVLDATGQPAPIGVPAELYIGGDGLARGYLDSPALTAERFVPHPFSAQPGARLYRTGDLARYLADGNLEFLGRMDAQVKLRGFRIEPGEIEAVLATHESVAQAVVIIREDRPGDKRLVAYVVAAEGGVPAAGELRRLAKDRLPDYMVPSAVVVLDALPLTPNGKIDRRALPAPDGARQSDETYVQPRTDVERRVAAIWCEVLGVQSVGVEDNFFDLGGHSLLVVKLHARLRGELGGELTVVDIFRFPTVAALAKQFTQAEAPEAFADGVRDRARLQREAMARRRAGGQGLAAL